MIPALDLFSGLGGFTAGALRSHSIRVRVALNHDPDAIAWHRASHPSVRHLQQDAADADFGALVQEVGEGILLASPTCQQDSQCARPARAGTGGNGRVNLAALMLRNRARRSTAHAVLVAAELLQPRILLVENVPQWRRWELFPAWLAWLNALGYRTAVHELNAADYGSATERLRLIVSATRAPEALTLAPTFGPGRAAGRRLAHALTLDPEHPEHHWYPIGAKPPRTRDLIRAKLAQAGTPPFGVLNNVSDGVRLRLPSDLAPTLTTRSGSQLMLIDRDLDRVRILSPRELARIQGFPDSTRLPPSRDTASRLLGNAIPVELAHGITTQAEAALP